MARNKARRNRGGSLKPAQLNLSYNLGSGTTYIDLFSDLSKVNRRLYKQGKVLAIAGVSYIFRPDANFPPLAADLAVVSMAVYTAGDTWTVQNAWTKAKNVWSSQQRRARKLIGKSAKPTWEDFKVYLDDAHRVGTIGTVLAGDGGAVSSGEWDYSKLVWDSDDGATLFEPNLHLIGGDVGAPTDVGLILAYQQSRATVQAVDPDLPADYSSNIYAFMARDLDDVADEVAQNMEVENDEPPYDQDDYPGSDTNSDAAWFQQIATASQGSPIGRIPGFQAECGLVKVTVETLDITGTPKDVDDMLVIFHLMPGNYQGVLAENMGQ